MDKIPAAFLHCYEMNWRLLHAAISSGNLETVKKIINFASLHEVDVLKEWDQTQLEIDFTDLNNINKRSEFQSSFLALSIDTGCHEIFDYFINLYNTTCDKSLGIYEAMLKSMSDPSIFQILVEAFPLHYFYATVDHDFIPLRLCFLQQAMHVNIFLRLLSFEPDIEMWTEDDENLVVKSAVHAAVFHDDTRILQHLFDEGVSNCISFKRYCNRSYSLGNLKNRNEDWPYLLYAVVHGSTKVVQCLLKNGADIYQCVTGDYIDFPLPYDASLYAHKFKVSALYLSIIHKQFDM